jgi:copper chaperone NosL
MAKAKNWQEPGASNWVDAKQAFFVVGSRVKGGMGADETVPFSDPGAAEKFAAENGGRVVAFAGVSPDYVLGAGTNPTSSGEEAPSTLSAGHGSSHSGRKAGHAH